MRKIALMFSVLLLAFSFVTPIAAQDIGEFEVVDTEGEFASSVVKRTNPVGNIDDEIIESPDINQSPEEPVSIDFDEIPDIEPIPSEESVDTFVALIYSQKLGTVFFNPIKYAIRNAITAGIAAETVVLLLLLPVITTLIAAARHIVGLRGFGIFLPAALAVVFMAIGPVLGIVLFIFIVIISTTARLVLRRTKIKLQYLPRMSLILLFVVLGVLIVLFTAPYVAYTGFVSVSIFPILILILLSEEFTKVQIGKSANVAVNLTTETLILALASYVVLTLEFVQTFALLHPELLIVLLIITNYLLGKYVGLRFAERWRFRKIISG